MTTTTVDAAVMIPIDFPNSRSHDEQVSKSEGSSTQAAYPMDSHQQLRISPPSPTAYCLVQLAATFT